MRIKITHKKLTDSPYSKLQKDSFIFEDMEAIAQLTNELTHGNASTYLISGYRGSGKTSIINRIEEDLDDAVVVKMSLSKHESYNLLLRKLIRQLYFAYTQSKHYEEKSEFFKSFTLLYERTFHEITLAKSEEQKLEIKKVLGISLDLRKLIPIAFTILTGSNLILHFLSLNWVFDLITFIGSIILTFSTFDFGYSRNRSNNDTSLLSRKSLYDDEISEFQLLKTLESLREKNVNVIIIFDELDKIDDLDKINSVVNEIKLLLLSGLAHFIVVSGQTLYYQFEKSFYKDDAVMFSLFSKTIHIQLLSLTTLKQYILNLIEDNTQKENLTLNRFIDSLILQSRRIPRRLSNMVRNLIIWENNEAFLEIDETRLTYESDSTLCHLLNGIIENDLPAYTSNKAEIDFYTSMLHLYALKTKLQGDKKFQLSAISKSVHEEAYDLKIYPQSYFIAAESFCKVLLNKLSDTGLLKIESIENVTSYTWTAPQNLENTNENAEESGFAQSKFLEQFNELEQYVREIYFHLPDGVSLENSNKDLPDLLNELFKQNIFKSRTQIPESLHEVFQLRTEIMQGKDIKREDLDKLIDSRVSVTRLRAEVIEGYSYFIANQFLSKHGYNVSNELKEFDFVGTNGPVHLLFEVRYSTSQMNSSSMDNILGKYMKYALNKANVYFILLIYQLTGKETRDSFYKRFVGGLRHKFENYRNNIFVYNPSYPHPGLNTHELENFMAQVLGEIENKLLLINKIKGRWTNEWSFNDPSKKGQENLEITADGSYLIDGKQVFTIHNLSIDNVNQTVSFIKQRTDDGTRLLNKLNISDNLNSLIGIETNLTHEQKINYEIRYTKIND
jgi:hypothetical protein